LVNKICLDNSILSNSESCDGYPFNLQQFRDLIMYFLTGTTDAPENHGQK
jgi:hypothetical protein